MAARFQRPAKVAVDMRSFNRARWGVTSREMSVAASRKAEVIQAEKSYVGHVSAGIVLHLSSANCPCLPQFPCYDAFAKVIWPFHGRRSMIWIALGVFLALLAGLAYWWLRRRKRHRLISFVALVREAVTFDPAVLAQVAGKAWKADLGDGISEGPDGFVVGMEITNTIMHDGRMFLI